MISPQFDSVFSPYLAQFEQKIPFEDDEPYLPRRRIERTLDQIEDEFADNMATLLATESRKLVKKLEPAIAAQKFKAINAADWTVYLPLQQLMWGLWSKGWDLGQDHGFEAVEIAQENQKFRANLEVAEFAGGGKFDNRKAPLRKHFLEPIVEARSVWMSDRVSEDVKRQIKEQVTAATMGGEDGKKIGKRELYDRIGEILGEGEAATKKARKGIRARAKLIARTELSAVYTLGRLEAYRMSGLVRKVRYLTFEWGSRTKDRPCDVCGPRNGTVLDLATDWQLIVTSYAIPAHGFCRCTYEPLVEGNNDDQERVDDPKRGPSGGIPLPLKWLGATVGSAGQLIISKSIQDEIRRLQTEERQKKEQRKRALGALAMGGAALSFGAIFYVFLREAQRRGYGEIVEGTLVDDAVEAVGTTVGQAVNRILPGSVEQAVNRIMPGVNVAAANLLPEYIPVVQTAQPASPQDIILRSITPKLLEGMAVADPNKLTLERLYALGVSRSDAVKLQSFIQEYLKWQQSRPQVTIGNVNLNLATVRELVATGAFTDKQAAALVAYTQKQPLQSIKDLADVRYPSGQRAFKQPDVNRLSLYYLQLNLNDKKLNANDIANRFGVTPATAEKIQRTLQEGGLFTDWDDFRRRTKLSRDTIRRLQRRGARVDKLLLPELAKGLNILSPMRQLVEPQMTTQLVPRRIVPPIQEARKQVTVRIEDTIARVDQHLAQVENRIPKSERSRIDQAIERRDSQIEKLAAQRETLQAQSEQLRPQVAPLDARLARLEQEWSSGADSSAVAAEAKQIEQELAQLQRQAAKVERAGAKDLSMTTEQIAKVRLNRENLTGLLQSANDPAAVRAIQSEIQGLSSTLERIGIEDTQLRQRLSETADLLNLENSTRVRAIDQQAQQLQALEQQLRATQIQGIGGTKLLINLLQQRLNTLRSQGVNFSRFNTQFRNYRVLEFYRRFK